MRLRRFAALAAAIVLVLACSGALAQEQEDTSAGTMPPISRGRSDAIVNATSSSRGAVKALADCSGNANGTITVIGSGQSSGAPDVARIRMSIETLAPTAAAARAQAAETTSAVMEALGQFPGAETRSSSVSVYAQRDSQNGVTKTTGFQFRQSLAVTLVSPGSDNSRSGKKDGSSADNNGTSPSSSASDSLASLASRALDAAIAAGGDRLSVDGLEFEMNPEKQSLAVVEARSRALVDLREKAERDAANLGLQLGALLTVKVDPYPRTGGEPRAMRSAMASSEGQQKAPGTPLSSPDAETEVTAEGVYRVCSPS